MRNRVSCTLAAASLLLVGANTDARPSDRADTALKIVEPGTTFSSSDAQLDFCGVIETSPKRVRAYFDEISQALKDDRPRAAFNRFVAERFHYRGKDGRYFAYLKRDFVSVTPRFITREDWQEIARRGTSELANAGWRGCMLEHGKVWFQATADGSLELSGINHTFDWDQY